MPRTVNSIAWLDTPLWVDQALTGMSYWITLGSSRVRLTLPLEPRGQFAERLGEPPGQGLERADHVVHVGRVLEPGAGQLVMAQCS